MEKKADIGLIGLAVMGQNLVLNMCDHGYTVAVFNRTVSKVDEFLNDAGKGRDNLLPARSVEEFIRLLKRPRKVMLMVKAGEVVDQFIDLVIPHLEKGDIIVDGGNSHFPDSNRRTKALAEKGILFVGSGVSGGEEGARFGPRDPLWVAPLWLTAASPRLQSSEDRPKGLGNWRRFVSEGGWTHPRPYRSGPPFALEILRSSDDCDHLSLCPPL